MQHIGILGILPEGQKLKLNWLTSILRSGTKALTISLEQLAAAMIIIMALLVTIEALGRTLFGFSTGFTYEMIGALTGCLGFVGLAATFKKGSHIRILALIARIPKARPVFDIIAHVFALIFTCTLLRYAATFALRSFEHQEKSWAILPFPIYPFKFMMVIGLLVFVIVILGQIYTLIFKCKGRTQ